MTEVREYPDESHFLQLVQAELMPTLGTLAIQTNLTEVALEIYQHILAQRRGEIDRDAYRVWADDLAAREAWLDIYFHESTETTFFIAITCLTLGKELPRLVRRGFGQAKK